MFIAIDEFSPAGRTSWEESVSMWQVSVWSRLCFLPAVTGTCVNLGTVYAEKCLQRLESAWRCPQGSLSPTKDHNAPSLSHTQRAWELGLSQFPWLLSSSTEKFPQRCQLPLHRQRKVRRSDQGHSFFSGTVSVVGVVGIFLLESSQRAFWLEENATIIPQNQWLKLGGRKKDTNRGRLKKNVCVLFCSCFD